MARARLAKANRLADVLEAHGAWGGPDVRLLSDRGRRMVEELAGVPVSSDVTWEMAADLVVSRVALRARLASVVADPFGAFGG